MGWTKVELTKEEEEALQGGGNFFKFTAIGQRLLGRFVKSQKQTGQYAKADLLDYVFRIASKDEDGKVIAGKTEEVLLNANKQLHAKLAKCKLQPGYAVKITFTGEIDVGQPSKMKVYEVEFDASPAPSGAAKPPPPPPPPPTPAADDDVPF